MNRMNSSQPNRQPRYFTCQQVAELLYSSEGAVRQMIRRGRLPVVRDGRAVRIPREAVQAVLRERF
jgi:excisionase family DNA binding protein